MAGYKFLALDSDPIENEHALKVATSILGYALEQGHIHHDFFFLIQTEEKHGGTRLEYNFDPQQVAKKNSFYDKYWPIPQTLVDAGKPIALFLFRPTEFVYVPKSGPIEHHQNLGLFCWNVRTAIPENSRNVKDFLKHRKDFCEKVFVVRIKEST